MSPHWFNVYKSHYAMSVYLSVCLSSPLHISCLTLFEVCFRCSISQANDAHTFILFFYIYMYHQKTCLLFVICVDTLYHKSCFFTHKGDLVATCILIQCQHIYSMLMNSIVYFFSFFFFLLKWGLYWFFSFLCHSFIFTCVTYCILI